MNKADIKAIVEKLIKITSKEACFLLRTAARLEEQKIDISWIKSLDESDGNSEMLDAFVSRYSRLQDTLGDKLLPALLRASLEKTGAQLDNLLRAEKLGWVESTESWVELRELRNRLAHEYMETVEDLLEALQLALCSVSLLTETQRRMAEYAQQSILGATHFV